MSNYVKLTDYAAKDALSTGNPLKLIKGTEINDDLNAVQTAVATKADLASPNLLGNPTVPTQTFGNNTTRIANTAFVQQELTSTAANVNITGGTIDGVAITGGTISGLATDLAVADGGTGASSITLNSVILGNNTGALNGNLVAPSTSGNVLKSNGTTWTSAAPDPSIGVSQTWQDVKASRTLGVTYTNSTGRPIQVSISFEAVNGAGVLTVSGVIVGETGVLGGYGNSFITAIVPNGATYVATGAAIRRWAELR